MRIGIDASCLPPFVAGAGRYICGLVSALSDYDSTNEYFLFTKQRDLRLFEHLGSNFTKIPLPNFDRPKRIAWQLFEPRKLAKRFQLDVWHAPHYILPKGLKDVHLVVTFHDMTFFLFPEFYNPTRRWFFQRIIADAARRADTIVAVSKTTKHDVQSLFSHLSDRVVHVYSGTGNGFNSARTRKASTRIMPELQIDNDFILFVGTLERRKNVPLLVKAFAPLVENGYADLRLVLAGQRENAYPEILSVIKSLGVTNQVILTGYLSEEDLPALYSAASLFVYPSHYEGFGFPVLEAMACGTPVLTSDNSAMKEVAGLDEIQLSPCHEALWTAKIEQILKDPASRQRFVEHGLARAKELTWDKTARQMVDIYRNGSNGNGLDGDDAAQRPVKNARTLSPTIKIPAPNNGFRDLTPISQAILKTIGYSDLFDYPLKAEEIRTGLIAEHASIAEIRSTLAGASLADYIEHKDGFFFLRDKTQTLESRASKEPTSAEILKKNRRLLKFVSHFPFVRGAALSGAIAFKNCVEGDDIDLFLIVDSKRMWLTYSSLTAVLKLLGKRKLICLNYLFGKSDLKIVTQDFFVAHQIANLRPLSGNGIFRDFLEANIWVRQYLPQSDIRDGSTATDASFKLERFGLNKSQAAFRRGIEKLLGLKLFDRVEAYIYQVYSRHIRNITAQLNGSITVDPDQIRLFTNDHREKVLKDWQARVEHLQESVHEI